jgi:hypothetical protein
MSPTIRMSIVLATDTYETARPVVRHLRRQAGRECLEIVLVTPDETVSSDARQDLDVFGAGVTIPTSAPLSLPIARAAGVRAATGPIVFIGETHSFPHPTMCETLLAGFTDERCAAVVPAILNANPDGPTSWASYLTDYGTWGPGRPAGELARPLVYNGAYRRDLLLALGTQLEQILDSNSEDLWPTLHGRGYHARFEPAARVDHVNAVHLPLVLRIRFSAGTLIGGGRARQWPLWRRLAYVVASPLIPLVLIARARSAARFCALDRRLPWGTTAAIAAGALAKTAGEVLGYLGVGLRSAEGRLTSSELHKARDAGFVMH